ncbi:MAG: TonB-dependent receptor [Gammaproteobacteria bacterium]|nr:MAG: TonB-dependent receptor [Gammaproteobacteria bacterium]
MSARKKFRQGLKRSALSLAVGMVLASGAQAQSNITGSIFGKTAPGDTIVIENADTGFRREVEAGSDGSYRLRQTPSGTYVVTVKRADGTTLKRENVVVYVGVGTSVNFAGATELETIQVVGTGLVNPIDVSSVESTTIMTAEKVAMIPVQRDTTAVSLLAPGTIKGDPAFGNLASFGGSSVAENQYYFNGFNITNTFQNLNFAKVPYDAIAEQQIKTGGYGAEFGRSTGGVINQISKRGTNEFRLGGSAYWSPDSLSESTPNRMSNDGVLLEDNSNDTEGDSLNATLSAGGALIKDRLFAYGLIEYGQRDYDDYPGRAGSANSTATSIRMPKWLLKLDWNITDRHQLEFTALSDKREYETDYFDTITNEDNTNPQHSTYRGTAYDDFGGTIYIGRYTGYLTDSLAVSVLAGHGQSDRSNYSLTSTGIVNEYQGVVGGGASGCAVITDGRPSVTAGITAPITGCALSNFLGRPDAEDTRDQYRIDLEWQLGDHQLRGGFDVDNFESVAGESYSGGASWRYGRYSRTGFTDENTVVRKRIFQSGATVKVEQQAFYLEDTWSVTDDFIAYLGLRWDTFDNKNGAGESYVKITNQFAPRIGFSWDVSGDSTFKVFGNAGRYALPLTATVAVRGASASLYSEEFFTYTGVDPATGAPTGLTLIPNYNNGRPIRYLNNEFGVGKDASSIASENLEPMYQDEFILGLQKQLTEKFSVGVRAIYRDLKRAIDDQCDYRPLIEAGLAQGFTEDGGTWIEPADKTQPSDMALYNPGVAFCHLYNPGSDGVFNLDFNGDGTLEQATIPAEVLGPKARREYTAVEFLWEGNWDRLFLQGSYTWSKSEGNTEGGVKSDIGQDDTNVTQDFDYPELAEGSDGYLPNDRRHSLKLFGNFALNDQWSVGANLLMQSGRPINCFGFHPISPNYGNSYFYCDGELEERGTAGRLPWTYSLDASVRYAPRFADGRLKMKLDVFNLLNSDTRITVDERGEDAGGALVPATYKTATNWQTPRTVRFGVSYSF